MAAGRPANAPAFRKLHHPWILHVFGLPGDITGEEETTCLFLSVWLSVGPSDSLCPYVWSVCSLCPLCLSVCACILCPRHVFQCDSSLLPFSERTRLIYKCSTVLLCCCVTEEAPIVFHFGTFYEGETGIRVTACKTSHLAVNQRLRAND